MKRKSLTCYIFGFLICMLLIVVSEVGRLWLTYVDETIIEGSGYGFTIGDNKKDTYKKLRKLQHYVSDAEENIFLEITVDNSNSELFATKLGNKIFVETLLDTDDIKSQFYDHSQWDFYFGGTYFNKLTLKFCKDKLCEIYRHRKNFELP